MISRQHGALIYLFGSYLGHLMEIQVSGHGMHQYRWFCIVRPPLYCSSTLLPIFVPRALQNCLLCSLEGKKVGSGVHILGLQIFCTAILYSHQG